MGFWDFFEVASMPVLQVLIVSALGAFMATDYLNNLLSPDTRRTLNKIVFMVFSPSLMFASLAKTVTLEDIISWWFMPVNVGIIFLVGSILGWIIVKILKPSPKLEGLIIAACSSGNLGNLIVVLVSATCDQKSSPFGSRDVCRTVGLSYASFSMAIGNIYIWTHTFQIIKASSLKFQEIQAEDEERLKNPNTNFNDDTVLSQLLEGEEQVAERGNVAIVVGESPNYIEQINGNQIVSKGSFKQMEKKEDESIWDRIIGFLHRILEELLTPPVVGAFLGFVFGATKWLRNLIVGETAPLRVIQDSVNLLGEAAIPCIILLVGGNLTQGLRSSTLKATTILTIIFAKYIVLPGLGIFVVKLAQNIGLLPADPLFRYVLMVQYTLPPAMGMSTMTQLFGVGQEECSNLLLWTYMASAIALTAWPTVFMSILSA